MSIINKKVLIFGKFDILHPGHMHMIKIAQKLGDVIAVLESDKTIKSLHQYISFYNQDIRRKKLEKFGIQVYLRQAQDAQKILQDLKPDILCLGEDQQFLRTIFVDFQNVKVIKFIKAELFKSSKLKSILEDKQAGIYLIDKIKEQHSFKAVSVLRKVLNIKKVGFSGTLDPLASGLLILATGKATRLLDWFHFLPKTYLADIEFGKTSNTYDLEGQIEINKYAKQFIQADIEKKLKQFLGKQIQQAPIFSAKKVAGQKLHHLARQGKQVEAPSKEIEIYNLEIIEFKYPYLKLEIACSMGTYIRSLAHDLGEVMKQGALLADLRRSDIGQFSVEKALSLEQVNASSLAKHKLLPQKIIEVLNQFFRDEL